MNFTLQSCLRFKKLKNEPENLQKIRKKPVLQSGWNSLRSGFWSCNGYLPLPPPLTPPPPDCLGLILPSGYFNTVWTLSIYAVHIDTSTQSSIAGEPPPPPNNLPDKNLHMTHKQHSGPEVGTCGNFNFLGNQKCAIFCTFYWDNLTSGILF